MNQHSVEYTDTVDGKPNYEWARRATVTMPELPHYGYNGLLYHRELMRRAKASMGLTGVRGRRESKCYTEIFRPHGSCKVLFVGPAEAVQS